MSDVFVSYKAEDRARVRPLVAALESEGFTVWWDARIGAGADWREEIREQLDAAHCTIVAWSDRSVGPEGQFVCDEASRARKAGTYLPIKIDEVDPPLGFGGVQALSFVGWKGKRNDPRFRSLVAAVSARQKRSPSAASSIALAPPRVSRRTAIGSGVCAIAVGGIGSWALLKSDPARSSGRIAVMSFSNLSGDPGQAYFSDGIAEELRSALSRIGMQVIGKASCDAVRDLGIPSAAAKLGVANILTGSVRRSPDTIRIGAQLVNGQDGVERWAENYDRAPGDTIKIQTDIAAQVASALSIALGAAKKAALTVGGTTNAEAQDLVHRALPDLNEDSEAGALASLSLLNRAAALDPQYAEAFAYKALVLDGLGAQYPHSAADGTAKLSQAASVARHAIALAPQMPLGHAALAAILRGQFDFRGALKEFDRALTVPGADVATLGIYGETLGELGRFRDALTYIQRAIELDPLNPLALEAECRLRYWHRDFSQAETMARRLTATSPNRGAAKVILASIQIVKGLNNDAGTQLAELPAGEVHRITLEAILAAHQHDGAKSDHALADLRRQAGDSAYYQYAQIHAQRGEVDEAFAALREALRLRDTGLPAILVDPFIDPLRGDARYLAVIKALNLPS